MIKIELKDRTVELTPEEVEDLREIGRHSYSEARYCLSAVMLDDYGFSLAAKGVVEAAGIRGDRLRLTLDGCDTLYELTRAEVRRAAEQPAPALAVEAAS